MSDATTGRLEDAPQGYGPEWSAALRRGSAAELQGWVEAALSWCDAADLIALRHFRQAPTTTQKPDRSFVTEADTEVERLLRERIADAYPGHGVVGEEFGSDGRDSSTRWLLDPIDGTHNYMRGVPIFATLLAVERDGEIQAGVISAPALGQRWFAYRGAGAWAISRADGERSPRRIRVSGVAALSDAQLLYRALTDMRGSRVAAGFDTLLSRVWRERGYGDFWGYALVADGAAEAMVERDLGPWDLAAPWILVEEAGGRITDFDGRRSLDRGEALATNGVLHAEVLAGLWGARTLDEQPPAR